MSELFLKANHLALIPVRHGFSTRLAGTATEDHDVSNMAKAAQIERDALVTAHQVHGDHVVEVSERPAERPEADALITTTPGVAVGVLTADCVPVLMANPERTVVAAVHAGWRGVAASIVPKVVGQLAERHGVSPGDLLVAIGPAIDVCCYEVSNEVANRIGATVEEPETVWADRRFGPRPHVDLRTVVGLQLQAAGVAPANIEKTGGCTSCNPAIFFSHRRDGEKAGRQLSFVSL